MRVARNSGKQLERPLIEGFKGVIVEHVGARRRESLNHKVMLMSVATTGPMSGDTKELRRDKKKHWSNKSCGLFNENLSTFHYRHLLKVL